MTKKIEELTIEGVTYVPKDSANNPAQSIDGMPFVVIRGYGSGVNYGYLKSRNGCEVVLINSRRIWSWNKATETNQIALCGVEASTSKVTMVVPEKLITDCIEVINITEQGAKSLTTQPIWQK